MNRAASSPIVRALLGAAAILIASAALTVPSPEYLTPELSRRLLGVILGAVVVMYANAAPKTLSSLARMRCVPAAEQALRRFTGWALVLGGLGYAGAWLVAPFERAPVIAVGLLGSAFLLVVVRYARAIIVGANAC